MNVLERNGVRAGYEHCEKLALPGTSIALGDTVLKWYEIAREDAPVPASVADLARLGLVEASRLGELRLGGELGFVILHRCGEDFYFLCVATWQNDNELWQTVWAKDGADDPEFHPWPMDGTHRPTYCVWELGAVMHERKAWIRFLRSRRDQEARHEYLRDSFAGAV